MRLRPEAHLILWVTAGLSLAGAVFYGTPNALNVTSEATEAANLVGSPPIKEPPPANNNESRATHRTFPEVDQGVRPLFDIVVVNTISSEAPVAPVTAAILPVLKGIISGDGNLHAIFVLDPATETLTTAQIGDHLAGYWIRDINRDGVVATTDSGTKTIFSLRGAGESQ
jgi:hypothetical protein